GAGAWVRDRSGARRVAALGLGIGGLAAWLAAANGGAIDDLVLWGVPARARTLVRELRAFAALAADDFSPADADEPAVVLPEGHLEVAGFLLCGDTVDTLSALDLTATPLPAADRRRV